MADCIACTEAEARPKTSGSYQAACPSCQARMLAHSHEARLAKLGEPAALQAAMLRIWQTAEQYRRGRVEVHRWIKTIEEAEAKEQRDE